MTTPPALAAIRAKLARAACFFDIQHQVEGDLLDFLAAERLTIYKRSTNRREITALLRTGEVTSEIRLAQGSSSIAGYVAMSQQGVCIPDVGDAQSLKIINPNLRFDASFDQQSGFTTRSVVATPIRYGKVSLGVLQAINKRQGVFDHQDLQRAMQVAELLAEKIRDELNSTRGAFDYLVETGQITPQILDLVKKQKGFQDGGASAGHTLMTAYKIPLREIATSLERYYQVPFMAFDPKVSPPAALLKNLNTSYLRKQLWVPVSGDFKEVVILMDDPTDAARIMEIERVVNAKGYSFRVGLPEHIVRFIDGGGGETPTEGADIDHLAARIGRAEDPAESDAKEESPTVIQLVNKLILLAHQAGSSDIHIQPGKAPTPTQARIRVDGVCRVAARIPGELHRAVVARIKIMSSLDITESRKPQDGKCVIRFRDRPLELRVATIPTVNGETVVLRILAASEPLPLDKLNLSPRNLAETRRLTANPHGIFLVVGPTGSGKTTTLHSILGHINTPERIIWTAEDPVEISQAGMQQVQVKPAIGFTFAAALRSFLRADPDVIMIGEMRDHETAHIGVEASLTGHLVFSTLHTNSAPETVTRMLDLGLDPISFSDALLGVLAQRLMRVLCKQCKIPQTLSPGDFDKLVHLYGAGFSTLDIDRKNAATHTPKGCDACGGTGYKGRTGIHELLVNSEEMRALIYRKATAAELHAQATREGMRTLVQDGIEKVLRGESDLAQLRKVVGE